MSRPIRLEFPDALYHITSCGERRENIYDDDADREAFLKIFSKVIEQNNWYCYSYCLMNNHYHLLVQTPDVNLSKGMRPLNGIYTQYYNCRHGLTDHLFQGRYKSILVDQDAYLAELIRYIVLNPVKAGMVKSVEKWVWSSYRAMVGMTPSPEWLASEFLLSQLSKQRKTAIKRYWQFVSEGLKNSSIWHQLSNQVYLGDKTFVDRVQKYLPNDNGDIQIPKIQRRSVARSLAKYERIIRIAIIIFAQPRRFLRFSNS